MAGHETVTRGQVVKLVDGKPSTVKLRLKELVEHGLLEARGKGRRVHYVRVRR